MRKAFYRFLGIWLLLVSNAAQGQLHVNVDMSDVEQVKQRYVQIYDHASVETKWQDPSYRSGNWYYNEIQIPWEIATGILTGQLNRSDWEEALRVHIEMQRNSSTHGGANDVWIAMTALAAGLALNDQPYLEKAVSRMAEATVRTYSPREYDYQFGQIMEDGSYHFHGFAPSMIYGQYHFMNVAQYLYITENTSLSILDLPNRFMPEGVTSVDVLLRWFHDFIRWSTYQGFGDPTLYTKLIHDDPGGQWRDTIFKDGVPILLQLHLSDKYQRYMSEMQEFMNKSSAPIGAMSYPTSTYLAVRRDAFYAGAKMANVAMPNPERSCINPIFGAVNIVTPYTWDRLKDEAEDYWAPDRVFNLMTFPEPYLAAAFPEKPNPEHISGRDILKRWGYWGVSTLSGFFGLAAQDFQSEHFGARLSWFLFDDEIVSLGSNVWADPEVGEIVTVVNIFRVKDNQFQPGPILMPPLGEMHQIPNQNWLYHDRTGYLFLNNQNLWVKGIEGLTPYFVQLAISHGVAPNSSRYAVVYLPNKDRNEVEQYVDSPQLEILALNDQVHIVKEKPNQVVAASFFAPYTHPEISLNQRGYVMYQATEQKFSLSLYNPYQEKKIPFLQADEWGRFKNPMCDYAIHPENATYIDYEITVPFVLTDNTSSSLFHISPTSSGSKITITLRVTRKFEISGSNSNGNHYIIDSVHIGLNDDAESEDAYQYRSGHFQSTDTQPPKPPKNLTIKKK